MAFEFEQDATPEIRLLDGFRSEAYGLDCFFILTAFFAADFFEIFYFGGSLSKRYFCKRLFSFSGIYPPGHR